MLMSVSINHPTSQTMGHNASGIFSNPTKAINWKETEISDWSNQEFDEPPPFSDILNVNFNGVYFQVIMDFKKLPAEYEYLLINNQRDLFEFRIKSVFDGISTKVM